jgi:plasmid stabilization system protein ParE
MPYLVFSARAQADIALLYRFLAEKDMHAAARAVVTLRDAFQPLTRSPMIGRPVEERLELRELVIDFGASGYLALYRFDPSTDTVAILAIKHQLEIDYK